MSKVDGALEEQHTSRRLSEMLVLKSDPVKGRGYAAQIDIQKGHKVFEDVPFCKTPDRECVGKVCSYCVHEPSSTPKDLPLLPFGCAQCDSVRYCSQECQDNDLQIHSSECAFLMGNKQARTLLDSFDEYRWTYTMLLLRIITNAYVGTKDIYELWNCCDNYDAWPVSKLETMVDPARVLKAWVETLGYSLPPVDTKITDYLHPFTHDTQLSKCLLMVMKEENNAFGLYTRAKQESYGLAFFPKAIYFNHACEPNIQRVQLANGTLQFVALKDLPKDSELSISYVAAAPQLLLDDQKRKSHLKEYFLFDCHCLLCQ
ncbi:hypothetical protein EDD86DRAFT_16467 [Gorgonomyces haynaldii]|nr:hypothetical protein EDD86DRAFT_16467 [Gorgonomyces haynaldii]